MTNTWQNRISQTSRTLLILDSGEAGMTELPLQLEFEKQGHSVIHAHWANGNLHLETHRGITYLVGDSYEAKVYDRAKDQNPVAKIAGLLEIVEAQRHNPTSTFRVEEREDGIYLLYPSIRQDISKLDGLIRVVSGWEDVQIIHNVLNLQETLEKAGVVPLDDVASTRLTESKIVSQRCFEENDIPTPASICFPLEEGYREEEFGESLKKLGAKELVVKGEYGSHGENNHYATSIHEALAHVKHLMEKGLGVVVQEKIPGPPNHRESHYYRVLVLNGEVIGARAVAFPEGEESKPLFRTSDKLSDEQIEIAKKVARVTGQTLAGVDLGGTEKEPVVFETNSAPGLWTHQFFEGKAIPEVVQHLIEKVNMKERSTKAHAIS